MWHGWGMLIEEMQARAVQVRTQFAAFERQSYGREWSVEDLVLGLTTDVGDLAEIVQRLEGKRPPRSSPALTDLEHEISDCLWSLLVIADRYDLDVPAAFVRTMDELTVWLRDRPTGRG